MNERIAIITRKARGYNGLPFKPVTLYVLAGEKEDRLYIGISNNLARRMSQHTRARRSSAKLGDPEQLQLLAEWKGLSVADATFYEKCFHFFSHLEGSDKVKELTKLPFLALKIFLLAWLLDLKEDQFHRAAYKIN